jgi:hypothetical protein
LLRPIHAIDVLIGGPGADLFVFGHIRHDVITNPYLDKSQPFGSPYGLDAYGVIADFTYSGKKNSDSIRFGLPREQIFYTTASTFSSELPSIYGRDGTAFLTLDSDLIAFVPGLAEKDVPRLIKKSRIVFGEHFDLDDRLFVDLTV